MILTSVTMRHQRWPSMLPTFILSPTIFHKNIIFCPIFHHLLLTSFFIIIIHAFIVLGPFYLVVRALQALVPEKLSHYSTNSNNVMQLLVSWSTEVPTKHHCGLILVQNFGKYFLKHILELSSFIWGGLQNFLVRKGDPKKCFKHHS